MISASKSFCLRSSRRLSHAIQSVPIAAHADTTSASHSIADGSFMRADNWSIAQAMPFVSQSMREKRTPAVGKPMIDGGAM
ncbi:hypothetical protein B4915_08615 [Leucobacter massiliensis]|uniref:Uncharacterized protein n=1 Tax=Leucobacter massiliensis TaxID=1686285 RepID=A0A2S9QMW6_9MICO|nr:hypothetical protein B4915_08615 [Leucobacter massiliensis]